VGWEKLYKGNLKIHPGRNNERPIRHTMRPGKGCPWPGEAVSGAATGSGNPAQGQHVKRERIGVPCQKDVIGCRQGEVRRGGVSFKKELDWSPRVIGD